MVRTDHFYLFLPTPTGLISACVYANYVLHAVVLSWDFVRQYIILIRVIDVQREPRRVVGVNDMNLYNRARRCKCDKHCNDIFIHNSVYFWDYIFTELNKSKANSQYLKLKIIKSFFRL